MLHEEMVYRIENQKDRWTEKKRYIEIQKKRDKEKEIHRNREKDRKRAKKYLI